MVGNVAYTSSQLYAHLRPSIPLILRLLHDPLAKIRANAAGKSLLSVFLTVGVKNFFRNLKFFVAPVNNF